MIIKNWTIHRSVVEFQAGPLSPEQIATINVNVLNGHSIINIESFGGKTFVTFEKKEESE